MVVLFFAVIACMRVVQKICSKRVCNAVQGRAFFHYGGYYNLVSALFAVISVVVAGIYGFDMPTVLCALGTAVFMAIELFASLEALKGASLIVNQMFSVGSLFIPCIAGIFLFGEAMSAWEWIGLVLFMVSMYFMVASAEGKTEAPTQKVSVKTFVMLVITMLAGGGTMVVQKVFAVNVPNGDVSSYSFLMFAVNAVILYLCYVVSAFVKKDCGQAQHGEHEVVSAKWEPLSKELLVCGAFLALAVFLINLLVTMMAESIPSAVLFSVSYGISIIITLLVGRFCYGERLGVKNVIGIVLCVGALAMINFL